MKWFVIFALMASPASAKCGLASWYQSGYRTASGEHFNPNGLSIAIRSRDFGRKYIVTYQGKSIVVRHNDFGPSPKTGRQFDLSKMAAIRLGMVGRGVARVCVAQAR